MINTLRYKCEIRQLQSSIPDCHNKAKRRDEDEFIKSRKHGVQCLSPLSVVKLFTFKFFLNSPEILGVSIVLCHGVDLLEAVAADGEVRNLEAWYEEELNIHFKMYQITRSAMKEREKYIENKTGASHLRESEFCCFYASEGTRTKERGPQFLCCILLIMYLTI